MISSQSLFYSQILDAIPLSHYRCTVGYHISTHFNSHSFFYIRGTVGIVFLFQRPLNNLTIITKLFSSFRETHGFSIYILLSYYLCAPYGVYPPEQYTSKTLSKNYSSGHTQIETSNTQTISSCNKYINKI